jgi:maltose/moltooligosaccharide transporter
MDASFNIAFQPFRALVSDMVPDNQMAKGYSIQSFLINIGAVIGSILPFVLTNVVGLENTSQQGSIAPSVVWAFYIGATVLLGSVLWTVFKTKEYSPKEYYEFKGMDSEEVAKEQAIEKSLVEKLTEFVGLMKTMPVVMKRLALVQFFSWFSLFIMWVYTMPAIAQQVWGIDAKWFDPSYITSVGGVPHDIASAKGAAGDWVGILFAAYSLFAAFFSIVLAKLANTFGRKTIYSLSLLAGGLGFLSFMFIQNSEPTLVNLLITEITVPKGAVTLFIPMMGVGIAWAAILAMPYTILAGALPANKTGIYLGIFNFTIAAPQIVSGIFTGWILSSVFDNQAINIIMLAGISMVLGAISVYFIKEKIE